MESRVLKFAAAALLLLFVSTGSSAFAAPAQPKNPDDRIGKIIRRVRQFFTPTIHVDWPQPPVPVKP